MTEKTRRQSQKIVSMSPQSINAAIPRKYVRAVQDNRSNFVADVGHLPMAEIRELLDKLAPFFLVNDTNRAIRHHVAVSTASATRSYVSQTRKLLEPTEISTLGRIANTADKLDTRSMFEYQLRRPDFKGQPVSKADVAAEIDSIMLTGYTLHERQLHEKLFNYDPYMKVPAYKQSALRKFLRGLQQTERFALISDFEEAITDSDRSKQVEIIANRVREWLHRRSYCSCEQLYDLSRKIWKLPKPVQNDLAVHYGAASLNLSPALKRYLTPAIVTSIAVAAGVDRSTGITDIDENSIAIKVVAFLDAQKEAKLIGNYDLNNIFALYLQNLE